MRLPDRQSDYLDGWRGGSAIVVLIGHSFEVFQVNPSRVWGALAIGAVMVFFVLSGFFIRNSLDSCLSKRRPARFIAARVNRIVPPFLFSIVLTMALWALAPLMFATGDRTFAVPTARPDFSLAYLPSTLLFVNGFFGGTVSANGPLWTLSCEVWYYAIAFLLALKRWRLAGVIAAAVLTWRAPGFAFLGIVWALGFFGPKLPKQMMALPLAGLPVYLLWPSTWTLYAWDYSVGLAFAAHLAALPKRPPKLWISQSARWSYTLYVIHFPLLLFAYGCIGVNWAVPFMIFAVAAAIGPRVERIKLVHPRTSDHVQKSELI